TDIVAPLDVLPVDQPVGFDINYGLGINNFAFAANPRIIAVSTLEEASRELPAIYSASRNLEPVKSAALPYEAPGFFGYWLWFFPGPILDELEAEGEIAHLRQEVLDESLNDS